VLPATKPSRAGPRLPGVMNHVQVGTRPTHKTESCLSLLLVGCFRFVPAAGSGIISIWEVLSTNKKPPQTLFSVLPAKTLSRAAPQPP